MWRRTPDHLTFRFRAAEAAEASGTTADGDAGEAETPAMDPLAEGQTFAWRFIGIHTRTPIRRVPPINRHGDQVSYVARWVTARGEPGPFGNVVHARPAFNPFQRATPTQNERRYLAA